MGDGDLWLVRVPAWLNNILVFVRLPRLFVFVCVLVFAFFRLFTLRKWTARKREENILVAYWQGRLGRPPTRRPQQWHVHRNYYYWTVRLACPSNEPSLCVIAGAVVSPDDRYSVDEMGVEEKWSLLFFNLRTDSFYPFIGSQLFVVGGNVTQLQNVASGAGSGRGTWRWRTKVRGQQLAGPA